MEKEIKERIASNKQRKFSDISDEELNRTVSETHYYYLLADICESKEDNDKDAFEDAVKIAVQNWGDRDKIQASIKAIILRNVEPEDSYDDFEDSLFEATEHETY